MIPPAAAKPFVSPTSNTFVPRRLSRISARCALSVELTKTIWQLRASVLSFSRRTARVRSLISFPCKVSSRACPNGSRPRIQIVKGVSGLVKPPGGQSMNFAKLNKKAALRSYSPRGLDCVQPTGDTLNATNTTSVAAMISLRTCWLPCSEMPARRVHNPGRVPFRGCTDRGSAFRIASSALRMCCA